MFHPKRDDLLEIAHCDEMTQSRRSQPLPSTNRRMSERKGTASRIRPREVELHQCRQLACKQLEDVITCNTVVDKQGRQSCTFRKMLQPFRREQSRACDGQGSQVWQMHAHVLQRRICRLCADQQERLELWKCQENVQHAVVCEVLIDVCKLESCDVWEAVPKM